MSYLTENLFYQIEKYNDTSGSILAERQDNLLAPIVQQSQNFSVAVCKGNVPISSIPLTQDNIGLRKYAVTLGDGTHTNTTYVPQVGSTKQNFLWDSEGTTIYKRSYSASGVVTTISSVDYSSIIPIAYISRFIIDDYQNAYITGPTSIGGENSKLYIIGSNQAVLQSLDFQNVVDLYIDRAQRLYVADAGVMQAVYVFSNSNGENTVALSQLTIILENFAGDPLTGLAMVCAGDNRVIVGYNENNLTFYDSTSFEATHDFTEASINHITDGCIIDSAGTYGLLGQNVPLDTVFGSVSGGQVFNAYTGNQLTSNLDLTDGKYAVAPLNYTSTIAAYIRGTDQHVYINDPYSPSATQTLSSYVSPETIINMCADKSAVCALSSTGFMKWLNILAPSVTTPAVLHGMVSNFYVTGLGDVIDFDINTTDQKMFAVTGSFQTYLSDIPILPINTFICNVGGEDIIEGGLSVADSSSTYKYLEHRKLTSNKVVEYSKYNITDERLYYTYDITPTQVIKAKDPKTGVILQTYNVPELSGTICGFEFVGATYLVTATASNYYIYDIGTGALAHTVPASFAANSDTPSGLSAMYDIGNAIVVWGNFCIAVLKYDAFTDTFTQSLFDTSVVNGGDVNNVIVTCTANELDTVNGLPTVFAIVNNINISQSAFQQFQFGAGYSSISLKQQILADVGNSAYVLNCVYKLGAVFLTDLATGITDIYWENCPSPSYNVEYITTCNLPIATGSLEIAFVSIPQNISAQAMVNWVPFTVNGGDIKSIALSRYNPTVAYVVQEATRQIFKATVNYTTQTIEYGAVPVAIPQYDWVSTYIGTDQVVTSNAASFSLNTQTQQGSVTFTGVKVNAISKNEIQQTFGLIDATNFKTYDKNFTFLTSGSAVGFASSTCIDIRNGEDLDAGAIPIYDMAVLIGKINDAFTECYARLVLEGTSLTKAPVLSLDFQTGLLTLTYDASYLASGAFIQFNTALLTIAYFTNTGGVLALGPGVSVTQNSKSIFNFNDLQSVQFRSNNIFVQGQFYSTNLSSSRIICEIDPDTTTYVNNIGQRLYYNPVILRTFFLNSSLPLQTISIQLFYTTKQGKEYAMTLEPGNFFTTKLNFIRKF